MKRNYKNLPLKYPVQESFDTKSAGVPMTIYKEPFERTKLRKRQSMMKFVDKVAPKAVDAWLLIEEKYKKKLQNLNRKK